MKSKLYFALAALIVVLLPVSVFGVARVSVASGNWSDATTWSPAGVPTNGDAITVSHTVTINVTSRCLDLIVNAAGKISFTSGQSLVVNRDLTSAGTWAGSGVLYKYGAGTISSSAPVAAYIYLRLRTGNGAITIASGTVFSNLTSLSVEASGGTTGSVSNSGSLTLTSTATCSVDGVVTYNNSANGSLTVSKNISVVNGGTFNASGSPNTVTYTGTGWTTVKSGTYHHLSLSNGTTTTVGSKMLGGTTTVNGTMTIGSNVSLNWNNQNINMNGTWVNDNPNSTQTNQGTITFGGTSPNMMKKTNAQTFGNVVVNCTGTFTPNSTNTATYTGQFTCSNLTLQAGVFDLNSTQNYTITVTGNMSNTGGTFTPQNGAINFAGTAAQTISGNTMTFSNITVNNSAGVSTLSAQKLTGTLTVTSGTFTSNTAEFTLISNASTGITARVAALTTGSIAGNQWAVKRRILTTGTSTATAYWDDFSSPMTSSTLSDWDNEMYLSGVGGADGSAGTFKSVRRWQGTSNYTNVTSLISLTPGEGYCVWTATTLSTLTAFTMDTKGTPNSGAITRNHAGAGYFLQGNPYPSQIDWALLSKTNVGDYFFILDESLQDYATWDGSTGTGTGKLATSGGVINSSQGFLIEATGAGSISFDESDKVSTNVDFVKVAVPQNMVKFNFSNESGKQVGQKNMIHFVNDADNFVDGFDIPFVRAPYDDDQRYDSRMFALSGRELVKNTLNLNDNVHEIPVSFRPAKGGSYSISFEGIELLEGYDCIVLEDVFLNKFVSIKANSSYSFTQANDGERRFVVHFRKTNGTGETCVSKSSVFAQVQENAPFANVFANPAGIVFNYSVLESQKLDVKVYDSFGKLVMESNEYVSQGQQRLIQKPAVPGIYLITITDGKKIETHRIFVD
jgi:hypothetical protein